MGEKTTTSPTIESSLARFHRPSRRYTSRLFLELRVGRWIFSLFKGYLTSQLREKGKQFERSAKSDKEAADIKYEDNQRQFEVNLRLDNILAQIDESASSPADIHKLVAEGKLIIQEYETDDLASDSEDKKKIRKAKAAAEKKRKEATEE